jgi:hypothetical protein
MATRAASTFLKRNATDWIKALEDPNPIVRRLACRALEMIWFPIEQGSYSNRMINGGKGLAVRVWERDDTRGPWSSRQPTVAALFARLRDPGSLTLSAVVWHLVRLGPDVLKRRLLKVKLRSLLSDPDPSVQQDAVSTFRRLRLHLK